MLLATQEFSEGSWLAAAMGAYTVTSAFIRSQLSFCILKSSKLSGVSSCKDLWHSHRVPGATCPFVMSVLACCSKNHISSILRRFFFILVLGFSIHLFVSYVHILSFNVILHSVWVVTLFGTAIPSKMLILLYLDLGLPVLSPLQSMSRSRTSSTGSPGSTVRWYVTGLDKQPHVLARYTCSWTMCIQRGKTWLCASTQTGKGHLIIVIPEQ